MNNVSSNEVQNLIYNIRECDVMIKYFREYETYSDTMIFCKGTKQGTRDAMLGGLIQRKQNLTERLTKMGIQYAN